MLPPGTKSPWVGVWDGFSRAVDSTMTKRVLIRLTSGQRCIRIPPRTKGGLCSHTKRLGTMVHDVGPGNACEMLCDLGGQGSRRLGGRHRLRYEKGKLPGSWEEGVKREDRVFMEGLAIVSSLRPIGYRRDHGILMRVRSRAACSKRAGDDIHATQQLHRRIQ